MGTSVDRGAVVVGLDATPSAGLALAWAVDEAACRRLSLHLVIAIDAPDLAHGSAELTSSWTSWGPAIRAAYAPVLEDARDFAVQRHPGLRVVADLAIGSPADVLRDRAPGSSMVVVGSRHRGVVRDLFSRKKGGPAGGRAPALPGRRGPEAGACHTRAAAPRGGRQRFDRVED
ncbi:universal stress protein [Streptomyces sp. NBC_01615]|uniref:universal stress protein n=1 Tax=Streptomyces sp. NBC_01615 TaxID=2975898 RepID=UPI00386B6E4A